MRLLSLCNRAYSRRNPEPSREVEANSGADTPGIDDSNPPDSQLRKLKTAMKFIKAVRMQPTIKPGELPAKPGNIIINPDHGRTILEIENCSLTLNYEIEDVDTREAVIELYKFVKDQGDEERLFVDAFQHRTRLLKAQRCFGVKYAKKILKVHEMMQEQMEKSCSTGDLVLNLLKIGGKYHKYVKNHEKKIAKRDCCTFFQNNKENLPIKADEMINTVHGQLLVQLEFQKRLRKLLYFYDEQNPGFTEKVTRLFKWFDLLSIYIPVDEGVEKLESKAQDVVGLEASTPVIPTENVVPIIGDNSTVFIEANDNEEVNRAAIRATDRREIAATEAADGGDVEHVIPSSANSTENSEITNLPSFETDDTPPLPQPLPDTFGNDVVNTGESIFEPDPKKSLYIGIDETLFASVPEVPNEVPELQGEDEQEKSSNDGSNEKVLCHHKEDGENEEDLISKKEEIISKKETVNTKVKEEVDSTIEQNYVTKVSSIDKRADTHESTYSIPQDAKSNNIETNYNNTTTNTINNQNNNNTTPDTSCQNQTTNPQKVESSIDFGLKQKDITFVTANRGGTNTSNDSHSLRSLERTHIGQPDVKIGNIVDDIVDIQEAFMEMEANFVEDVIRLKDEVTPRIEEMNRLEQENCDLRGQIIDYLDKFKEQPWIDSSCLESEEQFQNAVNELTEQSWSVIKRALQLSNYGCVVSDTTIEDFLSEIHSSEQERGARLENVEEDDALVVSDGASSENSEYHIDKQYEKLEVWKSMLAILEDGAPDMIKRLETDIFNIDFIVKSGKLENDLFMFIYEQCRNWERLWSCWYNEAGANTDRDVIIAQLKEELDSFTQLSSELFSYLKRESIVD
ncbi:hypothetical protein I9W82_004351 [Candida metapsilosis]|uniref:Uncharacterized protein n=1 Tax=Candida metapsilosis TaxID=273372 RepID=A0A8H7ZG35_9ASCO|nr:hypothetical protein I9W82_004351 [Candida metapsilosis]